MPPRSLYSTLNSPDRDDGTSSFITGQPEGTGGFNHRSVMEPKAGLDPAKGDNMKRRRNFPLWKGIACASLALCTYFLCLPFYQEYGLGEMWPILASLMLSLALVQGCTMAARLWRQAGSNSPGNGR